MGTNFYAETIGDATCDLGHVHHGEKISFHLGKRSAGWPFLRHADELITHADEWDQRATMFKLYGDQWIDENGRRWDTGRFS